MVDIVVLCPLALEYFEVRRQLRGLKEIKDNKDGFSFEIGELALPAFTWRIAIGVTGSGELEVWDKTDEMIRRLKPKYIFLTGIAGGVKDVEIGDVVLATKAYNYEGGKEIETILATRPKSLDHDAMMVNLTQSLFIQTEGLMNDGLYRLHRGPIASGNKVLTSLEGVSVHTIKTSFNDTLAVEMEAYAFAKAAQKHKVKSMNIRGISDLIINKNEKDEPKRQEIAALRAAQVLIRFIGELPIPAIKEIKKIPAPAKSKQQDPVSKQQTFSVSYTYKKFKFYDLWRTPEKGKLRLSKAEMILEALDGERINIDPPFQMAFTRMPGDIRKNWLKINFSKGREDKELFISGLNWSDLFGQGQRIYDQVIKYK